MEPIEDEFGEEGALELPSEAMKLNMGPSHPAMHGTIKMELELDGENVLKADVQPGYLHRGFEKSCERGTWAQVFPYADFVLRDPETKLEHRFVHEMCWPWCGECNAHHKLLASLSSEELACIKQRSYYNPFCNFFRLTHKAERVRAD